MKENSNKNKILFDDRYIENIAARRLCIEDLIRDLEGEIRRAPEGSLRIVDKKSYAQYYWCRASKDTNGEYLPKEKIEIAKALAQKEYNRKVLRLAQKEERIISKYDDFLRRDSYHKIYDGLSSAKKKIVNPIHPEIDDIIQSWLAEEYEPMPFMDNTEFYSTNGVRVRSKSELIIANLLEQYDVPYKYEKPLILKGKGTVRPDFVCLNKSQRKEYVWEHFGMMDSSDYANKNVAKLNMYQQNGYYLGVNMIASFETSQQPISSRNIKSMIEKYLL
ncbi:hypothetical protein [Pseudobutyrivibrio xylanivorans]|uniref:Uncharacterized protein n=1 Tax=Pseudobutyrivibrio xylanivorans DSM 14809 TaxID=1123012 RepID=A0A1M6D7Y2_PSEXY|nr:hypothetical protein [Pseudobutyrivibrio xylanivorans]SHI69309.1 hypothetical protein SAMN02745725_00883 [Pseudobutyrivibrio xylanivorans DSM 14809]